MIFWDSSKLIEFLIFLVIVIKVQRTIQISMSLRDMLSYMLPVPQSTYLWKIPWSLT